MSVNLIHLEENKSNAELIADLPAKEQQQMLHGFSKAQLNNLQWDWKFWGRPKQQLPLGNWFAWLILAGRGFGKAMPLTTEIPTANGFKTFGNIAVGDTIFDKDGNPCKVTYITDIMHGNKCYELQFSDGLKIVADAEHQWAVTTWLARKKNNSKPELKTVTTEWIKSNLLHNGETNVAIELAGKVQYSKKTLLIPPYTLGAWLGDGVSRDAQIVCHKADLEVIENVEADGFTCSKLDCDDLLYHVEAPQDTMNFRTRLKTLNIWQNKHIPKEYLESSVQDRTELLMGLMDTDGSITPNGYCEYSTKLEAFGKDVLQLIHSLHMRATLSTEDSKLYGKVVGKRHRITFTPTENVFMLPRKRDRCIKVATQQARLKRRFVKAVVPVESVPVRCITVDSPSSTFLVTRDYLVTHNTRTGSETVLQWAREKNMHIALVGRTVADIRDVMLFGESGIITCAPPAERPTYIASKRLVLFPNGVKCYLYTDEDPEQLRGPQHYKAWVDELCKFSRARDTWDNLELGLRLGIRPQVIVTTTPKPGKVLKDIMKDKKTVITTGSSYENKANLSETFIDRIISRYEGTRIGEQELHAKVLEDVSGALWNRELIAADRLTELPEYVRIIRTVVAIDPSVSSSTEADECGIVVACLGADGRGYVLADCSLRANPNDWMEQAIEAYDNWFCDRMVGEVNQGGDLIETLLRTKRMEISFKKVHAAQGKKTRAEPISALYEQGKVSHIGEHPILETEMAEWVPGEGVSPNRVDALVWALTELMLEQQVVFKVGKMNIG